MPLAAASDEKKGVAMREIRSDVARWFEAGCDVALAQVTKTWGSSPRAPGSIVRGPDVVAMGDVLPVASLLEPFL